MTESLLLDLLALKRGPIAEGVAWVGRREQPRPGARQVGVGQVESFAALIRDDDPRYWTPAPRRPVPPGLLLTYTLPLPWSPHAQTTPIWARIPLPGDTLINVGTSTVFHREIGTGDTVILDEEVVSVSAEKKTRLGTGHFLTTRTRFQIDEEPVADHTNVMFRYGSDSPRGAVPVPPAPPLDGESVFTLTVTSELCVHNVAASGDFFPGHYDDAYARSQGAAGAYLNTMFFQGLADRLACRHLGVRSVRRRDLRMLTPSAVGDTLEAWARTTTDGAVEVEVRTARGPVAIATVWCGHE
ncbi:hypothetical protein E1281_01035 [Actinomadura sp. KC345]|uniref:FAS1-like dehydratase domain-containing protein n=1 Tax=Actinomadura sp. KC345 TaxID=2530371 RepID=UPI0010435EBB|nr:MaoC family dehydratase N-terminal domain-containing protein [Actinomadura sp. KC345]TDC58567.1 hypothetical protein E1281_01035 [Actinomadura sp. KC345]